jgi:hypothetical protein
MATQRYNAGMSQPAKTEQRPWKPWALAMALLVVSTVISIADLQGAFDANSTPWKVIAIAADVGVFAGLIWIIILMKPGLWPPRK